MSKGISKKIIALIVAVAVVVVSSIVLIVALPKGNNDDSSNSGNGNKGTMLVDLHALMPSANQTVTAANPVVVSASKYIAEAYTRKTGWEIEWATEYSKPTTNLESMVQWYNTQVMTNNCPAIGFSFGTGMQQDDMYIDLTQYLERPNHYVEGNVRWKDCFEDWVWDDPDVLDANGKIVSIPFLLNPGNPTAVFYNKKAFEDSQIASVPQTWAEYLEVANKLKKNENVTYPVVPYMAEKQIKVSSWVVNYNLAPGFAAKMMEVTDYDKSGRTTTLELIRAVKEGHFNPNTSPASKALYTLAYEYYKTIVPTGWVSIDFLTPWNTGKVGMMDNGLWQLQVESFNSLREFDFGVFTAPVATSTTSPYAADLEKKSVKNGYQSNVLMAFNIMKPAVKDNLELLEQAIDFLMYLTQPDAISEMCVEHAGSLPAVKGAEYSSLLDDYNWGDIEFYNINASEWPTGFTIAQEAIVDEAFREWINGTKTQQQFYNIVNEALQKGADDMISLMGIDTTDWSNK